MAVAGEPPWGFTGHGCAGFLAVAAGVAGGSCVGVEEVVFGGCLGGGGGVDVAVFGEHLECADDDGV